nr:YitT family protein [Rubeoparvulum massiliense]
MLRTHLSKLAIIIPSSVLLAASYNMFLLPNKLLSSGLAGIAMIIGLLTPINTGLLIFLFNVPLFIMGYRHLGRRFVTYSVISVAVTSLSMYYIPLYAIAPNDPLLSAVFGGVTNGIAIGLILRASGSTGGFDIIGLLLTQKKDYPLGTLMFAMNAVVVLLAAFFFDRTLALYTLISIYVVGRVVDTIHTRHIKLTLMIITSKGDEMKNKLLSRMYRGITIFDGEGAYTHEKRKILYTVISRYELVEVKKMIRSVDPKAFVNITETVEVMGAFHRDVI